MSVIGPRPGLWNQDILTAERDKYNANDVKPGLSSWRSALHASQFCINSPYILFCPFDNRLVRTLFKEDGYAFLAFRTLCRRIFINLVRMDDKKISDYPDEDTQNTDYGRSLPYRDQ